MAVNNFALFPGIPKIATARLTTATGATELGSTAPTNLVQLKQAGDTNTVGTSGGKLLRAKCVSQKTTAAVQKIIRFFDFDGTNYHLFYELEIAAGGGTPSATQTTKDSGWVEFDKLIPPSGNIYVATTVSENAVVIAEVGDYAAQG